jgi:hypothetical protein
MRFGRAALVKPSVRDLAQLPPGAPTAGANCARQNSRANWLHGKMSKRAVMVARDLKASLGHCAATRDADMFRENTTHLQSRLHSTLDELPAPLRQQLVNSWAGTFRAEVFAHIDEQLFAVLYSDQASRPNVPVNVLVGLEILKSGFGWSDEELYQAFMFDLQVRYALGYEQLGDGYFAIRTLYEFRQRVYTHLLAQGEHLLEQVFAHVTAKQMKALGLKSDKLRMDSTQIASHIAHLSRLQLLVTVIQRLYRVLSAADRTQYAAVLEPYLKTKANRYVYRLKPQEVEHRLTALGPVLAQLVTELATRYQQEAAYGLLVRVFQEHFVWTAAEQRLKPYTEVGAASLQSPADPEATYHRKREESYIGYAANITETCHPDNPVQLIVKVQTEPNATDDAQLLIAAVPDLVARTDVQELYTDGGYNSPAVDPVLAAAQITHIQTALRGDSPHADCVSLVNFTIQPNADAMAPSLDPPDPTGVCFTLVCPQGQTIPVFAGRTAQRFIGRPDPTACAVCPLLQRCTARPKRKAKLAVIYFDQRELQVLHKRKQIAAAAAQPGNLRAAVEATVRSVKHPFRHGKVLVRTKFRVGYLMLTSALMVNLRRIHRLLMTIDPKPLPSAFVGFIAILWTYQLAQIDKVAQPLHALTFTLLPCHEAETSLPNAPVKIVFPQ